MQAHSSTLGGLPAGLLQQYQEPTVSITQQGVLGVTAQIETLTLNSYFTTTDALTFNGQPANTGGTITGIGSATTATTLQALLDALPGLRASSSAAALAARSRSHFTKALGSVTSSAINPQEFGNISGEDMTGAAVGLRDLAIPVAELRHDPQP